MDKQSHTPGPWTLDCGHAVIGGQVVPLIGPDNASPAELWANSQLIAAAPELLAALREITDAYLAIHNGEETAISAKALAVIAKAEGR